MFQMAFPPFWEGYGGASCRCKDITFYGNVFVFCGFFLILFAHSKIFVTFATVILAASPLGVGEETDIYIKRRNCTLWF
jgi:hypothetical protein